MNTKRLKLLGLLPLLLLDGLGNVLVGGSFKNTLSGEAHHHREHKYWGWTHAFINGLFRDPKHCEVQAELEKKYGSWWGNWKRQWKETA